MTHQKLAMNKINTSEIKQKTNNKFIIYFFVFAGVLLIGNIIIRTIFFPNLNINPSQYQFVNKDGSSTVFLDIKYSGSDINIPESLSIAQNLETSSRFSTITDSIKNNLNLVAHPEVKNLWTSDGWYFNYQESSNHYILLNTSEDIKNKKTLTTGFNKNDLLNFSRQQKNVFFPNLEIVIQENDIKFKPSAHEYIVLTTIDKGTVALVPFAYSINNYPIFYEKDVNSPFEFMIESDLTFRKMTYFPQSLNYEKIGEKNSITIEQALDNIKEKKISSIIAFYQELGTPLKIEEIKSADFKSVSIEYRVDSTQNLIYPFFKFEGTAITENDELWIELITPAIEIAL